MILGTSKNKYFHLKTNYKKEIFHWHASLLNINMLTNRMYEYNVGLRGDKRKYGNVTKSFILTEKQ